MRKMKEGIYVGPMGQLINVTRFKDFNSAIGYANVFSGGTLVAEVSERQSFYLENGMLTREILYLLDGFEYLGPL